MSDIESVARHPRIIAFNAKIMVARVGQAERKPSVVASTLTAITNQTEPLVRQVLASKPA